MTSSPRWTILRHQVADGISGAALDRCEDEIDAYICVYVALYYWSHGLVRCRVVGDLGSGYIVTPVTDSLALELDRAGGRSGRAARGAP